MDFPIVEVPFIGGRVLIAIVGITHVLISHGCAVGGSFFLVLLEYKSLRESNARLNELAYRLARWFFILTTSVGAMTGVGIWFTTNMFSPGGIGSLLRIFFWAWFVEWIIFVAEVGLVSVYYLSWKRMSPRNHLKLGIVYLLASFQTLVVIVGILGFQLTSGRWPETGSFWDAFFNPTNLPQLFSRTGLAALLACGFSLFIFACMREFKDVRRDFLRFSGIFLMIASPIYLFATLAYYQVLPERAEQFISVALVTLQLTQYAYLSKIFFFVVVTVIFLSGTILLFKQKTYGVLSVIPIFFLILATIQFSRVREFSRKPYVINKYMYSNGFRVAEMPFISDIGASRHATWAWRGLDPKGGTSALGHMLFRLQCSVCHTYRGINGIFNKKAILSNQEATLGFLDNYQFSHPYMPPFAGTQQEKEALAKFLTEGATGVKLPEPEVVIKTAAIKEEPGKADAVELKAEPETQGGESLFKKHCSLCHLWEKRLVGPPVRYMIEKYSNKKAEMTGYVLNPIKINPDYPNMPKPAASKDEIERIVDYLMANQASDGKKAEPVKEKPVKAEPVESRSIPAESVAAEPPGGEAVFNKHCSICHKWDERLVGPPVSYMVDKYSNKKGEMVAYVLNPFKVDPDYPNMPKPSASEDEIEKVVDYILEAP